MNEEGNETNVDQNEGQQGSQNGSSAGMSDAEKRAHNLETQNANLKSVVASYKATSGSQASAQPSSAPSASSQPASSTAGESDELKKMRADMEAMQKQNAEFKAQIDAENARKKLVAKGNKDGLELTDQDIQMITGSNDQDATYKYIKSLKANAAPKPQAPKANIYKPNKENAGALLASSGDNDVATGLGPVAK